MSEKLGIYKCEICGNIIQVLISGEGELICCSQPMKKLEPQKDSSELGEKHAPKYEELDSKKFVNVKTHPMTNEHYIQFIETQSKDKNSLFLKYFTPNEIPQTDISFMGKDICSVEYCNIHGLWGEDNND